jgi:protein SCO1/2
LKRTAAVSTVLLAVVAATTLAAAAEPSSPVPTAKTEEDIAREYFSDLTLTTMQGESVRFYSDVLKDRVVLINSFYTSSDGITPRQGQILTKLQGMLGDRLGRDFFMVSITIDPENDTPEKIREFAQGLGAGPGWIFLTGPPENVLEVNRRLGQQPEHIDDHKGLYLLGNVATTLWVKLPVHAVPSDLNRQLQSLLVDKGEPGDD